MSCSLLMKWACQRQVCLRSVRCLSNYQKGKPSSQTQKDKSSSQPPKSKPSKVVIYAQKFVIAYEGVLERRFPKFYTKYSQFKFCMQLFVWDCKEYRRINVLLQQGKRLETFSRQELLLYRSIPREFSRALPVLIVAAVPFGIYLLPLVFFIPKRFLPSHFSNQQQMIETALHYHHRRIKEYPRVIQQMEKKIKNTQPLEDIRKLQSVIATIQQQKVPSNQEVISIKPLFEVGGPFELSKLGSVYRGYLMSSMGFDGYFSPMETQARIMLLIDKELLREGTSKLSEFEVIEACFHRGINPLAIARQQRLRYLTDWLAVTKYFDTRKDNISMMLHSCTLLAAGHPSNIVTKTTE